MTHDPMCFIDFNPLMRECRICDLIARVREDEAKRIYSDEAMEAVIRLAASKAYDAALQDALAAVSHHDQCHAVQYAEYGEPCDCWREDAVAQIEAIGGER